MVSDDICTTGEAKFPECGGLSRVSKIRYSGKLFFPECCTRGREASPSVVVYLTLGEERHSGKALFPERNTRGRTAPRKEKCYLTAKPTGAVTTKNEKKSSPSALLNTQGRRSFPSAKTWLSGKRLASPSAVGLALGEGSLSREPRKTLGEEFLFF